MENASIELKTNQEKKVHIKGFFSRLYDQRHLQMMAFPGFIWMFVFCYMPMYGIIIAFKDYNILKPMLSAPWADKSGFFHFFEFFQDENFITVLINTVGISFFKILIGFPLPILFAILLNELRQASFKRVVQTVTYLPHFISWVILGGLMMNWLADIGLINDVLINLKLIKEPIFYLAEPKYFWGIAVLSDAWKETGWNAIIYLAAISSIDPQLYEASTIDGCNRWRQVWNITLPGIMPTVVTLLILNIGGLMGVGFEKIILMYSPATYSTADVISTYVYRRGIIGAQFGFGTAVGVFNSVINFGLLFFANRISKHVTEISLW